MALYAAMLLLRKKAIIEITQKRHIKTALGPYHFVGDNKIMDTLPSGR